MGDNTDAPGVTAGELAAVLQAMDEKYKLCLMHSADKQRAQEQMERPRKKFIHYSCLM